MMEVLETWPVLDTWPESSAMIGTEIGHRQAAATIHAAGETLKALASIPAS
jgi:hypothetical protein